MKDWLEKIILSIKRTPSKWKYTDTAEFYISDGKVKISVWNVFILFPFNVIGFEIVEPVKYGLSGYEGWKILFAINKLEKILAKRKNDKIDAIMSQT